MVVDLAQAADCGEDAYSPTGVCVRFKGKMRRGEPIADGIIKLQVELDKDEEGQEEVDITAKVTDGLLKSIADAGGKVVNSFAHYEAIRAWIPLAQIEPLAERGDVKLIRPAVKAVTNVGSVVSEGYFTHKVNVASNTFRVTGAGIKIGVLSDSVDYLSNSQASGDLGNVTVLPTILRMRRNCSLPAR